MAVGDGGSIDAAAKASVNLLTIAHSPNPWPPLGEIAAIRRANIAGSRVRSAPMVAPDSTQMMANLVTSPGPSVAVKAKKRNN